MWTSSSANYAGGVVRQLFVNDEVLEFVFAREKCVQRFDPETQDYYFIKDLRKVKARGHALGEIIMLDDTPKKLIRNYGNLMRMSEWMGDPSDCELAQVQALLLELKDAANIRTVEKRGWQRKQGAAAS